MCERLGGFPRRASLEFRKKWASALKMLTRTGILLPALSCGNLPYSLPPEEVHRLEVLSQSTCLWLRVASAKSCLDWVSSGAQFRLWLVATIPVCST